MAGMTLQEIMAAQLGPSDMGGRVTLPAAAPKGPSKGAMILGILGDALAGAAGRGPAFGQAMMKRKETEQEQAQWGLRRQADLEDYGRKLEMQNDPRYAKPESRYWEDNAGNQWKLGANGQPERFFTDMAPKSYIYDGQRIDIPNPYNTALGATAASPPATIDESLWSTGKPVGGQMPRASGGFPR